MAKNRKLVRNVVEPFVIDDYDSKWLVDDVLACALCIESDLMNFVSY